MKLVEQDFFVGGTPTQGVWNTYVNLYRVLNYRKKYQYPRYRKPVDEQIYRSFNQQHPPHLVKPEILELMGDEKMIMLPNVMPYSAVIDVGVSQYILWLKPDNLASSLQQEELIDYAQSYFGLGVIAYFMQNVIDNCSICNVPHFHAFVDNATIS